MRHPFGITTSGRVAVADQNSDEYIDTQLTVAATTILGEREMCIPFGVPDAAFGELSAADLQTCVNRFGPDGVVVTRVVSREAPDEFAENVTIEWTRSTVR